MTIGQEEKIILQAKNNSDGIIDLTSKEITFTMGLGSKVLVKKNSTAGGSDSEIKILDSTKGIFVIYLNRNDTLGLEYDSVYYYEVNINDTNIIYGNLRTNRKSITDDINMVENYTKYLRIEAVSPNTFTIEKAFGWTSNPTVSLVGGNIVIASSGSEFTNDSLVAVSQLDTTFSQTTSSITLTPASASWGTMTIIVKIY